MKQILMAAALVALLCGGPALAGKQERSVAKLMALTPEHFGQTATVKDDSLDVLATISTEKGFTETHGLLKFVWDDSFLRGFINKTTGATTVQVYQTIYYSGDWRNYNRVTYETPEGPKSGKFQSVKKDVVSCAGARYGGCSFTEHMLFEVDEKLLRVIAATYVPGAQAAWKFKFGAQSSAEWTAGLTGPEVIGFLTVLDTYRAQKGLKAPEPEAVAAASEVAAAKPSPEMNSDFRKRAKAAIDRGDMKAAKEWLDMIVE